MRPVADKYAITQGFASMPTAGVAPSWTPDTVGWYVRLYGDYQPFGHAGVDIGCPIGTPVHAMAAGKVVWADWGSNLPGDDSWGALGYFRRWAFYKSFPGILTVIHHPQIGPHVYTAYAHLSNNDAAPYGTQVKEGQLIALSGNTGGVAPHLHIEKLVDPNYSTGGGLIYGRADPVSMFGTLSPQSSTAPTKPKEPFTVAQYDDIMDKLTAIGKDARNTWAGVWDGGSHEGQKFKYGILPIVAHNQTLIASQSAQIKALVGAIAALSKGEALDEAKLLAGVQAAAEAGVKAGLQDGTVDVNVTVAGGSSNG